MIWLSKSLFGLLPGLWNFHIFDSETSFVLTLILSN